MRLHMNDLKVLSLALLLLNPLACISPGDQSRVGIDPLVLQSPTLVQEADYLAGTGSLLFVAPIKAEAEGTHISLGFSLQAEGSLTVHMFSENTLADGIDLRFIRNPSDSLTVQLVTPSLSQNLSDAFSGISAQEALRFEIDYLNVGSSPRVLIWNSVGTDSNQPLVELTLASSINLQERTTPARWGLTLIKALITLAHVGGTTVSP